jgi:monoamine oxidase
MRDRYDIVIIGAGAAGLAAGRTLAAAGADFIILEARGRIGGRAWTFPFQGHGLDLGAGWLHAARHNYWRKAAEAAGMALDRSPPPWERRAQRPPAPGQSDFGAAIAGFYRRIEAAETEPDRPAAAFLAPGDPANDALNAMCAALNGATLDDVSAHDFVRYDGAGGNLRAPGGYGALIAALARPLPIELNVRVRLVDHASAQIRVDTDHGALAAGAVIIATPTPALARESLRISPALPAIAEAAAGLPLGAVDKAFLAVADDAIPPDAPPLYGRRPGKPSYDLRPLGMPVIEAFIAGPTAQALAHESDAALAALLIDDLAEHLGGALRGKLSLIARSNWARDPLAGGAYSYARPGWADARATLAAPATDRLFIAGEAAAPAYFGTAHGAADTGVIAAERALRAVKAGRRAG